MSPNTNEKTIGRVTRHNANGRFGKRIWRWTYVLQLDGPGSEPSRHYVSETYETKAEAREALGKALGVETEDGTSGQDRDCYSDDQDRDTYST